METPVNIRRRGFQLSNRKSVREFLDFVDRDPRSIMDLVLAENDKLLSMWRDAGMGQGYQVIISEKRKAGFFERLVNIF